MTRRRSSVSRRNDTVVRACTFWLHGHHHSEFPNQMSSVVRRRVFSTTRVYVPKTFPALTSSSSSSCTDEAIVDAFGGEENLRAVKRFNATTNDSEVVERQLGHACEQAIGAGRRCRHGYAQAVLYAPIYEMGGDEAVLGRRRIRAEHATCWLTCPRLVERVDALEQRENGIHDMAARVDAEVSGEMRRGLLKAHTDAARVRNYLIGDALARRIRSEAAAAAGDEDVEAKKVDYIVNHTGLIGVSMRGLEDTKTWKQIKCLHAQTADALVRGRRNNPIGARVLDDLDASGFDTTGDDECRRRCEV